MFIYNLKVSGSKIFKVFAMTVSIIVVILFIMSVYRIFFGAKNDSTYANYNSSSVSSIDPKNYTNILKAVHEDIDSYVGTNFKFTGYVYRAMDFNDNQFVLARNMVISSDYQTLIVGFLCESEKIINIKDNTWIEITGTITKGDYHGDMPIVKVTDLKEVEKPLDEYVYPPDDTYVPTNGMI